MCKTTVCSPMDEEPSMQRRLAGILAADIAGYSRLMHSDEAATVRDLKAHQSVILPLIGRHGGRIIDTAGDGIMAEFPSVIGATECAVEIQTVMAARNEEVPESRRMLFRIGINLGDVIHDEHRIYGDGINIAARLEALAEPGGVLVSGTVYDHVRGKLPVTFEDMGERQVKNIEQPVRIYQLHIPEASSQAVVATLGRRPAMTERRHWIGWGAAAFLVLLGAAGTWYGLPLHSRSASRQYRGAASLSRCAAL
jgi:adenylate cyclase